MAAIFQMMTTSKCMGISLSGTDVETFRRAYWDHNGTRTTGLYALPMTTLHILINVLWRVEYKFLSTQYRLLVKWRNKLGDQTQYGLALRVTLLVKNNTLTHTDLVVKQWGCPHLLSSSDDETRVQLVSWTVMLSQWFCKCQSKHKMKTLK